MQRKNTNIILFTNILIAFMSKSDNLKKKVGINDAAKLNKSTILIVADEEQVLPDVEKI